MSNNLTDPNKPAHAIIEQHADGSATRNDGVKLQAANQNPWYVMATLFGEQDENAKPWDYNEDLAAKNRRAWNLWFCQGLDGQELEIRAKHTGLTLADLQPAADSTVAAAEMADIKQRFQKRMQDAGVEKTEPPAPTENMLFSQVNFTKYLCFEKFVFEKSCDFRSAQFSAYADFGSAEFSADADFGSAEFSAYAYFGSAQFSADAYFGSAQFSAYAYFISAQFSADAYFGSAEFSAYADFGSAEFSADAYFGSAEFSAYADFGSAEFSADADFGSAQFSASAYFSSAKFKSTTKFDKARFFSAVPQFHATEIYDHTTFTLPANYLDNWPPVTGTVELAGKDNPVRVMPAADQKSAYNRLRLFMNKTLQTDEEQFFHRMEMRCKRETEGWAYRWIYTLFEATADYGNSVLRPAGWLAVIWLVGVIAKLQSQAGSLWPDVYSIPSAMGWSFANIFPFFGFRRLYFGDENLNGVLQFTGGAQTVFGFILLFLLGLGLRNRFRLR